ncbi:hypothetical protein WA158_003116 [Blastocystis sp. Blastoise]
MSDLSSPIISFDANTNGNEYRGEEENDELDNLLPPNASVIKNENYYKRLENYDQLKEIYKMGVISLSEFKTRKQQILDDILDMSTMETTQAKTIYTDELPQNYYNCIPRVEEVPPPESFDDLPLENAIKHVLELDQQQKKHWINYPIQVRICRYPFARGGLRSVYHMMEYENTDLSEYISKEDEQIHNQQRNIGKEITSEEAAAFGKHTTFVCKLNVDKETSATSYFRDVEMQSLCSVYAEKFNNYNPAKKIHFNKAWLVELVDRPGRPIVAVERFMNGRYQKHNNNAGGVNEEERNTPQAFSHYTYEASVHTLIVVDIQGVGDIYTDPQIHTMNDTYFGKGNLGEYGINSFLATHRCNPICKYLKLPIINPEHNKNTGTIPATSCISDPHVEAKIISLEEFNNNGYVSFIRKTDIPYSQQVISQDSQYEFIPEACCCQSCWK